MGPATTYRNALKMGTLIQEYRLDSVLGAGAFGMTYLAWDTHLEKKVAIKEYLPTEFAVRALDGSVLPITTDSQHDYQWGLDRFLLEARTLARFSHPNIVRVNRFFSMNGTAYVVMDYEEGESLAHVLKAQPQPDEARLLKLALPLLDGLQAVHEAGFLHRDIKPANVFIRSNGTPVLLDFGAARQALGGATKSLTAVLTPGYAPLEQYSSDGNQGPWTDIYALGGVLYRALMSENPPEVTSRLKNDVVPGRLRAMRGRVNVGLLSAIDWALTLDEKQRPQTVTQWREVIQRGTVSAPAAPTVHRPPPAATAQAAPLPMPPRPAAAHASAKPPLPPPPAAPMPGKARGTPPPNATALGQPPVDVVRPRDAAAPRVPRPVPAPARASLHWRWAALMACSVAIAVWAGRTRTAPAPEPVGQTLSFETANGPLTIGRVVSIEPAGAAEAAKAGVRVESAPAPVVRIDPPQPPAARDDTSRAASAGDLPDRDATRSHEGRSPVALRPLDAAAPADHRPPPRWDRAGPDGRPLPPPGPAAGRLFVEADLNSDGFLTRDEAHRVPLLARHFEHFDADGDGRIGPHEFERVRASLPQPPRR